MLTWGTLKRTRLVSKDAASFMPLQLPQSIKLSGDAPPALPGRGVSPHLLFLLLRS